MHRGISVSFVHVKTFFHVKNKSDERGPFLLRCYRKFRSVSPVRARYRVELVTLARRNSKDVVYDAGVEEYARRMSHSVLMTERTVKPENAVKHLVSVRDAGSSVLLLDENGHLPKSSVEFANLFFNALRDGGSKCSLVIGEADGLPPDIRAITGPRVSLVSLSPLTFTHKMVCVCGSFFLCLHTRDWKRS